MGSKNKQKIILDPEVDKTVIDRPLSIDSLVRSVYKDRLVTKDRPALKNRSASKRMTTVRKELLFYQNSQLPL